MNTKIPKLGETDAVIPNNTSPSYSFKRMNSALFKILSDLKESKSTKSPESSEKGSENDGTLAIDAQHLRLDRCLSSEGIFSDRKGSDLSGHLLPYIC